MAVRDVDPLQGAEHTVLSENTDWVIDVANSLWGKNNESVDKSGTRFHADDDRVVVAEAKRATPEVCYMGTCEPGTEMELTVYVKSKATDAAFDLEVQRIKQGVAGFLSEEEFERRFGASEESLVELRKFAEQNGLSFGGVDRRSGRVVLRGNVGQFSSAFGFKAEEVVQEDGSIAISKSGTLSVPKALAPHIEAVLGLDDRIQAKSHMVTLEEEVRAQEFKAEPRGIFDAKPKPMLPTEVASLYKFPEAYSGKGQNVALIELGGNPNLEDYAKYYESHGLRVPKINVFTVNDAKIEPGKPSRANGELALDSEVLGAVAPDAVQNMIIAPNNERGFIDAVERAIFTENGEAPNTAISISWGLYEKGWSQQGLREMNNLFRKAWMRGIGVYVAAGDDGAKNLADTYQADYPAADPFVTAVGGTRLIGNDKGEIVSETVWNNGKWAGSTGGGVSERWNVPDYQSGVVIPPNLNKTGKPGRGVPDIAGNADPRSGYIIRVDGVESAVGGTSAVAPLYAALHARLSEGIGGSKPTMIGNLNPFFYRHGYNGGFFNDISGGNNNGYDAVTGWDATTGWGSIKDGTRMLSALRYDIENRRHPSMHVPVVQLAYRIDSFLPPRPVLAGLVPRFG